MANSLCLRSLKLLQGAAHLQQIGDALGGLGALAQPAHDLVVVDLEHHLGLGDQAADDPDHLCGASSDQPLGLGQVRHAAWRCQHG